jgi:hypothetical protein
MTFIDPARMAKSIPQVRRLVAQRDRLQRQRDELREQCEAMRLERDYLQHLSGGGGSGTGSEDSAESYTYAFILTYGRSGSTLLQGVLGSAQGVLIRGENQDVPYELYRYHSQVMHHRDRLARPEPLPATHPWFGIDGYPEQYALRSMRRLVTETLLRPRPDTKVLGFKEINWPFGELIEYVDFLGELFPGARFIVNTRNLRDVAKSKWWGLRDDAMEHLTETESRILAAADHLGDRAFRIHYDDYCADPAALRPLFEWLGVEYDAERVAEVMGVQHSY